MIATQRSRLLRDKHTLWRPLPIGAAVVAALILNPLRVIPEGTACAKLRLGKVQNQPMLPGLHVVLPFIDGLDCMDVKVQSFQRQVEAATSNIQDLNAKLAVQWRLNPLQVPRVRREFGALEAIAKGIVAPKAEESFKTVSSTRTLDMAIGQRIKLKSD